jgi:hypothetical protein
VAWPERGSGGVEMGIPSLIILLPVISLLIITLLISLFATTRLLHALSTSTPLAFSFFRSLVSIQC